MAPDDELLSRIHGLIDQVERGNAETLLQLLARIVAAETLALQLQAQIIEDRLQWRSALHELRYLVWGILAILGVIVLILVIATIAQMVRGR